MSKQPNGGLHASAQRSSRAARKSPSFLRWTTSKAAKLFVWYSLFAIVFRCPAAVDDLDDSASAVCKPYLQFRDYALPYAQPYYDQYLAGYVDQARPYLTRVHDQIYKPGFDLYQQHAAPHVAEAQKYGQQQWNKAVKPQLAVLQKHAEEQYQANLAPHVKNAQEAVHPYYASATDSAKDLWEQELEPRYKQAAPHAQRLLGQGQEFAVKTALPHAQSAGNAAWSFWVRRVWPQLRVLYGENVEPQLMRISERLGRYQDGKKLEAEVKSVEISSKLATASSVAAGKAASLSSVANSLLSSPASVTTSVAASASAPAASVDPKTQFQQELKHWEEISALAVNEGADDLVERIAEIAAHQTNSQAGGVGLALVVQLEEATESAYYNVKSRIQRVASDVPEDADDDRLELAYEDLFYSIRNAGQSVKHRAQAVREWRHTYQTETDDLVKKALQSTLETIESIRELRLTEIGRKFASSSLPHKEWSKYNAIKKAEPVWRQQIEKAAVGQTSIKHAKEAADDVEARAMAIAEDAAKELARLKEVGKWKIAARDDGDDFATKIIPPAAKRAQVQVAEQIAAASEAVFGKEEAETSVESVTSVLAAKASDALSNASEAIVGTSVGSIESLSSKASSAVLGSQQPYIESVVSKASDAAQSAATAASEAIIGTPSGLSDSATDAASAVSAAILGSETPVLESLTSQAGSAASAVSESAASVASAASSSVKKVWGGAMAHVLVEAREPILDDDIVAEDTDSINIQSIVSIASDHAGQLTQIIQDALRQATSTKGQVESATSLASEQYASALAAASSVLFIDAKDAAESAGSIAQDRYQAAVTAASYAIYGTPSTAAVYASATSLASDAAATANAYYNAVISEAAKHYEQAKSRVSQQISGTPKPIHVQMYASVESAYSEAVAVASKNLQAVLSPQTQGPYQSISAIASSRLQDALSAASAQYQSAKIAVGAEPTPVHQQYLVSAQQAYYQGIGLAHGRYSEFLDAASTAVYGRETGTVESAVSAASLAAEDVASRAAANWDALIAKASEQVYGAPAPFTAVALSQAGEYAAQATSAAALQWEAVSSVFSELINGKEPDFTDSVYSRLQSAYSTGAPAFASSASGYASDAYATLASAVSGIFVPPTAVPGILEQVQEQLNSAVDAASAQVYGTSKGSFEHATEAAASAYSDAASAVSEAIYGTETGYVEAAQSSIAGIGASASDVISQLVFGAPTGTVDSVAGAAASVYSSLSSAAVEQAAAASAAVFGQEQTYMDGVQAQISAAVSSASSRLAEFSAQAGSLAIQAAQTASSLAAAASQKVHDEL